MSVLASVNNLVQVLERTKISYTIIGGIAVLLHGCRASTIDLDIYVVSSDLANLRKTMLDHGATIELEGEHQVRFNLDDIKVDALEADEILAPDIFRRSVRKKILTSIANVASVEDLIVLKTLADRPVDRRDVEELREIFGTEIDSIYIESKLRAFQA
jgi:hypothetical protein